MGVFISVEISWFSEFKKKIIFNWKYTYILQGNSFILKNLILMKICVYVEIFFDGKSLRRCKINSKIFLVFAKDDKALKFKS